MQFCWVRHYRAGAEMRQLIHDSVDSGFTLAVSWHVSDKCVVAYQVCHVIICSKSVRVVTPCVPGCAWLDLGLGLCVMLTVAAAELLRQLG